jgi:N-methylhydantoinase A
VPVVTDANIVVGKLNQKKILGGRMEVYLDKANKALDENICAKSNLTRDEAANGIITVVNSNMIRAIRSVSVEKGYDVREFSLMAFGGAGPLHACEVAEELGINEVIIPPSPGTLCSLGLLLADTKFDLSRTNILIGEEKNIDEFNIQFENMVEQGKELRSYGYSNEKAVVQFVSYRVSAIGKIDKPDMKPEELCEDFKAPEAIEIRRVLFQGKKEHIDTPVYNRTDFVSGQLIAGPCIVEQMDTTIVVPQNWEIHVDGYKNLKMKFSNTECFDSEN